MSTEPNRHFPVHPNLEQLRHQAKDLLKSVLSGDPNATEEFLQLHPRVKTADAPKLADAQLVLARSYGISDWPRLAEACNLIDAIRANDPDLVRDLVTRNPRLLTENARATEQCNWGPPMSYAANVGSNSVIEMLKFLGAEDVQHAFERACLQGRLESAKLLYAMGARPEVGSVMGPCETLNDDGLVFLLDLGTSFTDEKGDSLAPVGLLLQTYTRNPNGKHGCLETVQQRVMELTNTAPMAVHRGLQDLLEAHLLNDPELFTRTYSHHEIYPLALGCSEDPSYALHGTPLSGGTLLQMCVDFDEYELAVWMLKSGARVDAKAAVDADGFGGHTAVFGTVVSQPYRSHCRGHERFLQLFMDRGADLNLRASLRKELRFVADETLHEYRDVTPLGWGEQFHDQEWVNPAAIKLLRTHGGTA